MKCQTCNKDLVNPRAKKCKSCVKLGHKKGMTGKKHFNTEKFSKPGSSNGFYGRKHKRSSMTRMMKKLSRRFWNKKNNCEKTVENILNTICHNEYEFVGNGKFIIKGFCPDFVNCNGQKKIIEFFGDYWHNRPETKERDIHRLKAYQSLGYKTLVIWEKELQDSKKLETKILEFNKGV